MKILLVVVALTALLATGCASNKLQAWNGREQAQPAKRSAPTDSRLIVQISNVNDSEGGRNETALFVNGEKMPALAAKQRDEVYELSLPSGTHKVHAVFRAKSFWKDLEFTITTHDGNVRLYPDYTTFLTITLEKKSDGALLRKKNLFTETPRAMRKTPAPQIAHAAAAPSPAAEPVQSLSALPEKSVDAAPAPRPIIVKAAAPSLQTAPQLSASEEVESTRAVPQPRVAPTLVQVSLDRRTNEAAPEVSAAPAVASLPNLAPAPAPAESVALATGTIKLQINTSPANADVIIDDRYLGQSPLVTHVERGRSHVIQISKKGYTEKIKLLDRGELANQQTYFLIEKLEKEE